MSNLHTLVFHSLSEQIAVIDDAGVIIDVNAAWIRFGIENGLRPDFVWPGRNYLRVLAKANANGDSDAGAALRGIQDVIEGRTDKCDMEYPCDSPDEQRWFMMSVCSLNDDDESLRRFTISHTDITRRKLAEIQAQHLAMHDPLTGLANRRYFNEVLHREVQRSRRNQSPISLIAIDVDNFKKYNDELGHLAGDHCLQQLSSVLLNAARRPSDLAARIGGDEFSVLCGDSDTADAQAVAESIVKEFADLRIGFGGPGHVTASAGVATMIPRHEDERWLVSEADKALYNAKGAGRNRVSQVVG